jgi:adenylate cyclase
MNSEKREPPAPKRRIQSSATLFFTTLKERNIIQTLAAFIGGGWLITEIVHWILVDHYHFPVQFLDITIVTLLCILICTLTWQWFSGIEKRRRIKAELIIIPLFILATAYLDVRLIQHIGESEPETVSEPLPETPVLPLPDEPSIAVLPFVNMSGDPEQEYFSDGISEEIITALSKTPKLFVIARTSTFTYKGKSVKVQQVGRELGVKYVLEGSVRKAEDEVRITAQLVDAQTGHHLWAERYDRKLKEIFALQDEITIKILTSLQVNLTDTEQAAFFAKGTDSLEAYLKWLQAYEYVLHINRDDNLLGRQKAEEAIAIDPNYAAAYTTLGWTHAFDARYRWSKSPKQSMVRAVELARKAIALDDTYPAVYRLWGFIYLLKRQYDEAIAAQEKAVALSPNWAGAYAHLGMTLVYACRPEEGIRTLQKAIRLNPTMPPTYVYFKLGRAYRMIGQYDEAISVFNKALHSSPNNLLAYVGLASTYSLSGRQEEARAAAAEVLKISPKFSSESFIMSLAFKNQSENERVISALQKAGLK